MMVAAMGQIPRRVDEATCHPPHRKQPHPPKKLTNVVSVSQLFFREEGDPVPVDKVIEPEAELGTARIAAAGGGRERWDRNSDR